MLDGTPRTHDVTAMEDSHLLNVPPTAFAGLMQRPTFARAITMLLAGRVRALYGLVQASTLHSTQGRIAYRLGRLAHGDATQAQASQRRSAHCRRRDRRTNAGAPSATSR